MKKILFIALLAAVTISLCACTKNELMSSISDKAEVSENDITPEVETNTELVEDITDSNIDIADEDNTVPEKINLLPSLEKIQGICDLSTVECYIHGVTKSVKEAGTGISHGFEKERQYWIEYVCTVELGIDMSLVTMDIEDNVITVTLPDVKIINMDMIVDKDDIVMSEDGWINKNQITADDQVEIIEKAEEEIREKVEEDDDLQKQARARAEELISIYINQLAEVNEEEYVIVFN